MEKSTQTLNAVDEEPVSLYTFKTLIRAILGIAFGAIFLTLVIRYVQIDDVIHMLLSAKINWLGAAMAAFALNMAVRVARWRRLLLGVKKLPYRTVLTVLLVGYAINNVLPARIGELYRAHFAGRRFGFSRTTALASIMVERTMDGLLVVVLLVIGQFFVSDNDVVQLLTFIASSIFIGISLALFYLSRQNIALKIKNWPKITEKIGKFREGIAVFHDGSLIPVFLLSSCVWLLEALSIWCIVSAIGISIGFGALALITSVATLATLLPSSPGYIGTYQYAYVFTFGLLGYGAPEAVAASTAAQILLLGSVTLVGLGLYIAHNFRSALFNRREKIQAKEELIS